ncbi:Shugoshin_C domain-containing protein [Pseudozyma hubeiensis]|nr:Shugoshin_C domain-containing protein [Pseudozyma hubeiensis]
MPPATRREVRLSASLPDPSFNNGTRHMGEPSRSSTMFMPNMDAILDNFEQFKRKHISQNREIIKSNALHQLRIRELENRIHTLEAEKVQKQMDTVGLVAQLSQLRHAIGAIHVGWEAIGRGLTLSAGHALPSSDFHNPDLLDHLPASKRVAIEPNPNAAAVVRSIARAPEGHIECLQEEDPSTDDIQQPMTPPPSSKLDKPTYGVHSDAWQRGTEDLREAPYVWPHDLKSRAIDRKAEFSLDPAPSPLRSSELTSELGKLMTASELGPTPQAWSFSHVEAPLATPSFDFDMHDIPVEHDLGSATLRKSSRKSSRRQSGYFSQDDLVDSQALDRDHPPAAPSSDPYMPSEANSETMEGLLIYHGADAPLVGARPSSHRRPPTPLLDITNADHEPSSSYQPRSTSHIPTDDASRSADVTPRKKRQSSRESIRNSRTEPRAYSDAQTAEVSRTPGGRKRKIPNNDPHEPMPTPARLFSAAIDASRSTSASATADEDSEPHTGRTRRVRKSINYALPKLNTKMRKPDPGDLVPASTPHRSKSNTPELNRSMIGSTGDLSDIRRLHEAASLRHSPAERTLSMRSTRPSNDTVSTHTGDDDSGVRMADLFEIRQHPRQGAAHAPGSDSTSSYTHANWNGNLDGLTDTSDDDSRATSNADLGELAELEAAMGDLCTADDIQQQQVDTPRAPQPSMWPSRASTEMSASSSTDSNLSRSSSMASNATATRRPSLRRKTTPLPSRSRQSSAEQPLQPGSVGGSDPPSSSGARPEEPSVVTVPQCDLKQSSSVESKSALGAYGKKAPDGVKKISVSNTGSEHSRAISGASSSTVTGNERPPLSASGLAAGMKPKQRPASAGAASTERTTSTSDNVSRPRTFSGTTAVKANLTQAAALSSSTGSVSRSGLSGSTQRASLHSALMNRDKATPDQMTPRIGAKGLASSTTPSAKESPRTVRGTPILRPTPSTSSLASESSGLSSPALSAASISSNGTRLSTSTRTSQKAAGGTATAQSVRSQRPGTAGSSSSSSSSLSQDSALRLNGSVSTTGARSSSGSTKPHPTRSMPSLRRASEKAAVTSTPRITVRSSSSTLPAAPKSSAAHGSTHSVASIAASKVAKAISSNAGARSQDTTLTPMGLGIDFNNGSAEQETISLAGETHQALQSPGSSAHPSSPRSAGLPSGSPRRAIKVARDELLPNASVAKARRSSRRVSGMSA